MQKSYEGKTILITGAGGFLGQELVVQLLKMNPKAIRAVGHSELPLYNLMQRVEHDPRVRLILRDVTDKEGMKLAMEGVEIVIHTAAVKSIDLAHYNAIHAIRTNVDGIINLAECALNSPCLERMLFISSDKAVEPTSLYGATKLLGENVMGMAHRIAGKKVFCCTRSGNFYDSLMSVIPLWNRQAAEGKPLTVTDPEMMRYFIKIEDMARFVLTSLAGAQGGEIFIPGPSVMKEYRMLDIASAISTNYTITGKRPGEKLREPLWSHEEAPRVQAVGDWCFVLKNDL